MDFGIVVPTYGIWGDPSAIRDGIQAAEALGYHTVWFGDHIVIPDYATQLSPPNWLEPLSCRSWGRGRRLASGSPSTSWSSRTAIRCGCHSSSPRPTSCAAGASRWGWASATSRASSPR